MTDWDDQNIQEFIEHTARLTAKLTAEHNSARFEKRIRKAVEDGAGAYYEMTKHDIELVLEATGFIKERLDHMATSDELSELRSDVRLDRHALSN